MSTAPGQVSAHELTLPLLPAFGGLVPGAVVQRGSVVGCEGPAAVSLSLALAAGPSQQGAWVAVAGLPGLGLAAAAEAGVVLGRLVQVAAPQGSGPAGQQQGQKWGDQQWGDVLAAMIDGFDVVLLGPGTQGVKPGTARRLVARLRARGAVAITVAAPVFGADLCFRAANPRWTGLGQGHGVAQGRRVVVELTGRRVPRARRAEMWLPAADGRMCPLPDVVAPVPVDHVAGPVPLDQAG